RSPGQRRRAASRAVVMVRSQVALSLLAGCATSSSGRPAAAACACSTSTRTPCIVERPSATVDSRPTTAWVADWRSTCRVQAASLPPLQASSTGMRLLIADTGCVAGPGSATHVAQFPVVAGQQAQALAHDLPGQAGGGGEVDGH